MRLRYNITLIVAIIGIGVLFASSPKEDELKDDLEMINAASVKSIDEFISRFNGEEYHPQVKGDADPHRSTLITLFNWGDEQNNPSVKEDLMNEFVDSIIKWQTRLDLDQDDIWSELLCEFEYEGQRLDLTLILSREQDATGQSRWGIIAVKGFEKAKILTEKLATLSPVDHELNFISLKDWINSNPQKIASLRSSTSSIDQLSFFMGMVTSGKLRFRYPRSQRIHVLSLPGFIFTIEREKRNSINTGWLIRDLKEAGDFNKLEYINHLYLE